MVIHYRYKGKEVNSRCVETKDRYNRKILFSIIIYRLRLAKAVLQYFMNRMENGTQKASMFKVWFTSIEEYS